jgi:hypothetical protein
MTSDNDKTKSPPAPPAPKAASTPSEPVAKPEASPSSSYSRGEGQKPVTDAYKENWNRIYGKKKKATKRSK